MFPPRYGHASQPRVSWYRGQTSIGYTRGSQFTRDVEGRFKTKPSPPPKLVNGTLYVRGMKLGGRGRDPLRGKGEVKVRLYDQSGSGTSDDPTVAWLFDVEADRKIKLQMRQAHVNVARAVARANGFQCILIRKEAHEAQCIHDDNGMRVTMTLPTGREVSAMVPAELHMTVYMGPDVQLAWVSGHIYLLNVMCPRTGVVIVRQMDDPFKQRSIVRKDLQPVAEEFWLTGGTQVLYNPGNHQSPWQRPIVQVRR